MADKVQMKTQACETSLFHHGLVKLIVLYELQKVNREWSAFLFLCGFGVETHGTGVSPKAKEKSPSQTSNPVETRSKIFVKIKPRKKVKEPMIQTSQKIQEPP